MLTTGFDVARVRGLYPTLGGGTAYLEGSFAALQPESVIRAVITALRAAPAQPGSSSVRSRRSDASFQAARQAVGDLVGARPECIVVGGSTATLAQHTVWRLARTWQLSDEIVVSRLDHDAIVEPVLAAAKQTGALVRFAEVDVESGELPAWQYRELIGPRTRLVTLPLANPVTGAVPDLAPIAALARERGAVVLGDAGAAVVHRPIDLADLGVDLLLVSAASFGGPTVGLLAGSRDAFTRLDETGDGQRAVAPGALPVELLDGVVAAIDHVAGLVGDDEPDVSGWDRRSRLIRSIDASGNYLAGLTTQLREALDGIDGVTMLGSAENGIGAFGLTVGAVAPRRVGEHLARHGVAVWTGTGGHDQLMRSLGTDELGGAVFVGLMPYTSRADVDRLVSALTELPR